MASKKIPVKVFQKNLIDPLKKFEESIHNKVINHSTNIAFRTEMYTFEKKKKWF